MSKTTMGLQARITEAAKILKIEEKVISKALDGLGIDDDDFAIQLLDAKTTTEEMISKAIHKESENLPAARLSAAVAALKGRDPFSQAEVSVAGKGGVTTTGGENVTLKMIETLNKNTRNLEGMTDADLLRAFIEVRDEQMVHILDKRAKHRPFVVLQTDSEKINYVSTLELLKTARKMETPQTFQIGEGKVAQVYRVTELDPNEKLVEICPVCAGYLYKGRCSKCSIHFPKEVGEEARAYIKLMVDAGMFDPQSIADKRVVVDAAGKGVEGLKEAFPDMIQEFDKSKKLGKLPKLIEEIEVTGGDALHPFYTGNRKF